MLEDNPRARRCYEAAGWTLDGVTAIAWLHESQVAGTKIDHPTGVLQATGKL